MTIDSKHMWLEDLFSDNCLEYFKTCYKPCLGHRDLDSHLRNSIMFQSLEVVILRKIRKLLFLPTFSHFAFPHEGFFFFSPKPVLVFGLDFYFLFLETSLVRECNWGWAWTADPLSSIFQMLRGQVRTTAVPNCSGYSSWKAEKSSWMLS